MILWPHGLGALIEGGASDKESQDRAGTEYNREELRENATSTRWSEYLAEGILAVDGLTPSPNFVSCTKGNYPWYGNPRLLYYMLLI